MLGLKKFGDWLQRPVSTKRVAVFIVYLIFFKIVWTLWVGAALFHADIAAAMNGQIAPPKGVSEEVGDMMSNARLFLAAMMLTTFLEEVLFRLVPIGLVLLFAQFWRPFEWLLVPVVLCASLMFGLVHITNHEEITMRVVKSSIVFQGMGGLFYCILFLKVARLRVQRVFHAFVATTLAHWMWDGLLYGLVYALIVEMPRV